MDISYLFRTLASLPPAVLYAAVAVLAVAFLLVLARPRPAPAWRNLDADPVPRSCIEAKPLLSRWERRAMSTLLSQIPAGHHVCPQVRLLDMLSVTRLDLGPRRTLLNRLGSKSVDFAIVDTASGQVALVIELNDRTHDRADRRLRDELVRVALAQASIPLLVFTPGQRVDLSAWFLPPAA